jgi:arginase family enzyme
LHLDVDVLDAALMPAVDSPNPSGLDWDELEGIRVPLVRDPLVVGMEVTVCSTRTSIPPAVMPRAWWTCSPP